MSSSPRLEELRESFSDYGYHTTTFADDDGEYITLLIETDESEDHAEITFNHSGNVTSISVVTTTEDDEELEVELDEEFYEADSESIMSKVTSYLEP